MAEVITMPKLSDTMEEGAIAKWLIKEGEFLEDGAAFVEIETDKATMEYNAPVEGTVLKILVPAGQACALGAAICVVGKKGEDYASALESKPVIAAPAPAASKAKAEPAATAAPSAAAKQGEDGRLRASPLARKQALAQGLDLHSLQGSGPAGRIVLRDLQAAAKAPAPAFTAGMQLSDTLVPVTMMRKTIAKRLLAAKNDAPHFYLNVSANMTRMNEWRAKLNADTKAQKVSVNDLLVIAVSKALRRHPGVNASWEGDNIRQWGAVHVAVAVALPTGLVTPVLRHSDRLGVRELAALGQDLVAKARQGQLSNEDYAGGTFTISNLGMFGIEDFTAIINPPQAAILAVGATMPTPWARDGQVVVEPRMRLTLSCDHRVIDGAMGADFLKTLTSYLEDPLLMLA